jgi:hypothetical protein
MAIPREAYTGTAEQLFGFLAEATRGFMARHNPDDLKPGVSHLCVRVCFCVWFGEQSVQVIVTASRSRGFN